MSLGSREYKDDDGKDIVETVAIKTFNSGTLDKNLLKEFDKEVDIMKNLNHPNIVKIKTWLDDPLSIVMEYVRKGPLNRFVSSNPELEKPQLLKFAKDIACGMEYLGNQKIIHRDLAARNILVDDDDHVKISDFGLSRQISNYYVAQEQRDLPIKWYAPEAIENKYSFQSDVWSYGVTLYEIFSKGSEPNLKGNSNLEATQILDLLKNNIRLEKPSVCPPEIYEDFITPCWNIEPTKRPTFTKLILMAENFIASYGQEVHSSEKVVHRN